MLSPAVITVALTAPLPPVFSSGSDMAKGISDGGKWGWIDRSVHVRFVVDKVAL
jgi:hypothetical protein